MKKEIKLLLVLLTLFQSTVYPQNETYGIFTYPVIPGWIRQDQKDNIQMTLQKGNLWCIVGLYESTGTTGNADSDFLADWKDLTRSYTITSEITTEKDELNGWKMIQGNARATAQGQNLNIGLITFSGPDGRSTLLITDNDLSNELESEISSFMESISVVDISVTQLAAANQPSGVTTRPSSLPGSGDFPTPNRQEVIRSAENNGWKVEATKEYIQYSNPEIRVIQYFYIPPEDPNSNTDDEDLYWRKFLSSYFSMDKYDKFPNEPYTFLNRVESASGYARSNADGHQYFLVWIVSLNMHCSFLAITESEPVYKKYFSHPNDLIALDKYNYFPASAEDIQGKWQESGFAGAQMYYSTTGAYAGMSVASTAVEWSFTGNKTRYFTSGATGIVGALNTFTTEELGSFSLTGNDLVVQVSSPAPGKTHEFWCGFVAGKGGLLLKLQDKKYTAQINYLKRKE